MDDTIFKILEVAGTWLSGIGTVGAVIVSLLFAKKEARGELRIELTPMTAGVSDGKEDIPPERFIDVEVFNVGSRILGITAIRWQIGLIRKRFYSCAFELPMGTFHPPVWVNCGTSTRFYARINLAPDWAELSSKLNRFPYLALRRLRLRFETKFGPVFYAVPTDEVRQLIKREIQGTKAA